MEKQHMKIIIFSLILFIQDVTSINPFSEWSRQRAKHYNLEVEGKYLNISSFKLSKYKTFFGPCFS